MTSIFIDWGTTRFRAWLLDSAATVRDRVSADDGIMSVPPGGFPATLQRHVGAWLADAHAVPVVMAGMVGSRNGWLEAPYATMPCGPAELAGALARAPRADGGEAWIVPGIAGDAPSGLPDVMRGEETLALGAGIADGYLCLPGTHSKWIAVQGGRIAAFASFMTGESFGLFRNHSILGRLAETPADPAGVRSGAEAATRKGGLTHLLFSARTRVLAGAMGGAQVEPYLSALLIRAEIEGAMALFPDLPRLAQVTLVADGPVAETYGTLLAGAGFGVAALSAETALLEGLRRILAARGRPT